MTPFDAAWLGAAIRLAAPLLLAATGETVAERAGVINIGLEGMMLSGAFAGYAIGAATGDPWLGMLGALVVGLLVGLATALVTVIAKADQIVVGVGSATVRRRFGDGGAGPRAQLVTDGHTLETFPNHISNRP